MIGSILALFLWSSAPVNVPVDGPRSHGAFLTTRPTSFIVAAAQQDNDYKALEAELVKKHGRVQRERIRRGLAQVAALWRPDDGDIAAFAKANFITDPAILDVTLRRCEGAFEAIDGHMLEITRELKRPTELDLPELSPMIPLDETLAGWDPAAHVTDDLFKNHAAFVVLLNFPLSTLEERLKTANKMSRRDWAVARLTRRFARRVPAEVVRAQAEAGAAADLYIANYNIWMHHVLDEKGARVFPKGKRLISHWNLRDELKAQYAHGAEGANRQRVIVRVMERIVTQTIPRAAINNPAVDWNPFSNEVTAAPAPTIEDTGATTTTTTATTKTGGTTIPPPPPPASDPEPLVRYQHLLAQFHAARAADPYSPTMPTAIQRSFELQREMPEARVKQLLLEVLRSPLVKKVGAEIERRLQRSLEPQDLWYDGFKARSTWSEADLDAKTRQLYPNTAAFQADLPRLLRGLGFSEPKADFLSRHIVVDPARGAGHALQSARRGDFPRLRTRIGKDGMNYKGYNIAVHELGHNVEQVFSLYNVDSTLLAGVPNNAFTEALAFVFQQRDLELLGMPRASAEQNRENVLADFWATWEIAGVALVDVAVWHWLYEHPAATASELRDAVTRIAADIWREHYAPVLPGPGKANGPTPLLAIYSHMIAYPLYLTDYPLGHIIAFQIEEHLRDATLAGKALGDEFERMTKTGAVAPDVWMKAACGAPVSAGPLLRATEAALPQRTGR